MPKKLYACEVCNEAYAEEKRATECERFHNHAIKITREIIKKTDNSGKYPTRLIVEMSDGTKIEYKR